MHLETLTINRRFCGPSRSGNGGYVCGRIAQHVPGVAAVRLRVPPPLEVPLQIEEVDGVVYLLDGESIVGEGRQSHLDLAPPPAVSYTEALEASRGFIGFREHRFPRCFVCGPVRQEHDGLRIFAGPVASRSMVASPWRVDESLADAGNVPSHFIWAALDCPTAFAIWPESEGATIVLGQLTAHVPGVVHEGETCTVVAWPIEIEGRKRHAGCAVYSESGEVVGLARATWIEVPADAFPAESV